jgi:8-oxo-dGTP pyrophosphatase MutT (NUDIX family)
VSEFDPATVPVRDAATVMLVRDGGAGPEVFMLRRTLKAVFVGGAYVFPGGAIDDADRSDDLDVICDGRDHAAASALLKLDHGGLAYWIAAVRECFEEAGLLLATTADGSIVRFDDPDVEARFAVHRKAVHAGTRRLVDVCVEEDLRLSLDQIHYFAHWITPVGEPRRFDTRFFVARAPEGQVALHDDNETIDNRWFRPADALAALERGEIFMIIPTITNLRAIAAFDTVDALMTYAAQPREIVTVRPTLEPDGGISNLPEHPGP